jgi:hypothetical protein
MDPELDNDTDLDSADDNDESGGNDEGYEAKLGQLVLAVLNDTSLDVKAKRKKILKALQLIDDPVDTASDEGEDDEPADMDDADTDSADDEDDDADDDADALPGKKESVESTRFFHTHRDPAVRRLAERFDRLQAKQRLRWRRAKARQLCERAKLPAAVVTRLFLEQLIHAPDEQALRALIDDRRRLSSVRVPRSASPGAGSRMDVKEFANQLRKGA